MYGGSWKGVEGVPDIETNGERHARSWDARQTRVRYTVSSGNRTACRIVRSRNRPRTSPSSSPTTSPVSYWYRPGDTVAGIKRVYLRVFWACWSARGEHASNIPGRSRSPDTRRWKRRWVPEVWRHALRLRPDWGFHQGRGPCSTTSAAARHSHLRVRELRHVHWPSPVIGSNFRGGGTTVTQYGNSAKVMSRIACGSIAMVLDSLRSFPRTTL